MENGLYLRGSSSLRPWSKNMHSTPALVHWLWTRVRGAFSCETPRLTYRHLGRSVSQPRRQSLHLLQAGRACGMSAPLEVAQCRRGPGITCIRTSRFSAGGLLSVADAIGRWVGQDTPQNREQSSQVARRTTLGLEAISCARRGGAEGRVMASGCDALEGRKASIAADNLIWRGKRSPRTPAAAYPVRRCHHNRCRL